MRPQREPAPFNEKQLNGIAQNPALSHRERRLIATLKAKPVRSDHQPQLQEQLTKLANENARLKKRIELLLQELKDKTPAPLQEEHIEGADITRTCPKCGRTKAFVKLMDFAGCVKCGRTWKLEP